jgi:hypothetical protein
MKNKIEPIEVVEKMILDLNIMETENIRLRFRLMVDKFLETE